MKSTVGFGLAFATLLLIGLEPAFADTPTPSFFTSEQDHFFIDGGSSLYYMSNPEVKIGNDTHNNPLAKISDSGYTPMYHLGIGYYFCNCGDNCIAHLFGNESSVELSLDYMDRNDSVSKNNLGLGYWYYINGDGAVYPEEPKNISNFKLTAEHEYISSKLYLSGTTETSNPNLTFNPSAGLVYTNLNQYYDFNMDYQMGFGPDKSDEEHYKVTTHYFGIGGGEQANYGITSHTSLFVKGELQLLYALSLLAAHQSASDQIDGADNRSVTNRDARFTYRTLISTGLQYQFLNTLDSPRLVWSIGGDLWGYNPEVVPPRSAGNKIHVDGKTQLDGFTQLQIIWPFY